MDKSHADRLKDGAFKRTLQNGYSLSSEDLTSLEGICGGEESVERRGHLIRAGADSSVGFGLIEGWALRYRMLPDGKRRIFGFLLPGDICNVHVFDLGPMDYGIEMLSQGKVLRIPRKAVRILADARPTIGRAIWRLALRDDAILREWFINISGRDAYGRVAHLLCELSVRMANAGLVDNGSFSLPVTQIHLAEALGLTSVHINRMFRRLRLEGILTYRSQRLVVHDIEGLKAAASFNSRYLDESPV